MLSLGAMFLVSQDRVDQQPLKLTTIPQTALHCPIRSDLWVYFTVVWCALQSAKSAWSDWGHTYMGIPLFRTTDYQPGSFLDTVAFNLQGLRDWLWGNDSRTACPDLRINLITALGGKL